MNPYRPGTRPKSFILEIYLSQVGVAIYRRIEPLSTVYKAYATEELWRLLQASVFINLLSLTT